MNQSGGSGGILTTIFIVLLAIALFAVLFGAFLLVPLLVVIFGFVALLVAQRSAGSSGPPSKPDKKENPPDA
jgi:hypothetical protein